MTVNRSTAQRHFGMLVAAALLVAAPVAASAQTANSPVKPAKPAAAQKPAAAAKQAAPKAAAAGGAQSSSYWSVDYSVPDYGRPAAARPRAANSRASETTTEMTSEFGRVPLQNSPGSIGLTSRSTNVRGTQFDDGRAVPGLDPNTQKSSSFVGLSLSVPTANSLLPPPPTPWNRNE
jgi:hypothetical protein